MVPEVFQTFWAAMQRGEFITDAAAEAGTYRQKAARWLAADGGVRPRRGRNLKGRCLTLAQREEIAIARARGHTIRAGVAAEAGEAAHQSGAAWDRGGGPGQEALPGADLWPVEARVPR